MAGAGFHSLAKLWAQMCTADRPWIAVLQIATDRSLNLRADCHRPELAACLYCYLNSEIGNPQYTRERFANGLFLMWQTAVFEHGAHQVSKFQYPPFYIDCSPLFVAS
jgi:hypothetical protein